MTERVKSRKVDSTISAVEGNWAFTSDVAKVFDTHVRKSIPLYEEFQRMTIEMSEWFIQNGSIVYDLGSSTGETLFQLQKRHKAKENVRFIGIDNSEMMVSQAREKASADNVQFLHKDVLQMKFGEADLVTSLFTLQFLGLPERTQLLEKVYQCLRNGGALIMAEKILAEEAQFDEMWVELYWDFKKRHGLTDGQILQKARSIRGILRPFTLTENIRLLRTVGFDSIDIFLKWYNFCGLLAVKKTVHPAQFMGYGTHDGAGDRGALDKDSTLGNKYASE